MKSDSFVKKIRIYSLLSVIIPLIAINSCLFIFKFLGDYKLYQSYNYAEIDGVYTLEEVKDYVNTVRVKQDVGNQSYIDCPKYKIRHSYLSQNGKLLNEVKYENYLINNKFSTINLDDPGSNVLPYEILKKSKIKSVKIQSNKNQINHDCVKNNIFFHTLLKSFPIIEKTLKESKLNNKTGFGNVENPYFYGEVSISRTARFYPTNLIFKSLIILSAFLLLFYWKNNINFFNQLVKKNILNEFSKKFFYFGILSCLFLSLHAIFLGIDFDSKLFHKFRRIIIILFICFEILAQFYLTKFLFKNKKQLKDYTRPLIINFKVCFVIFTLISTFIIFLFMIWGDLSGSFKNILEWNYISLLLVYYLLSRMLWKSWKTKVHTPEGV